MALYIYQGRIEGEQFIAVNVLKNIDNQVTYMSIEKFMGYIFQLRDGCGKVRNKQRVKIKTEKKNVCSIYCTNLY